MIRSESVLNRGDDAALCDSKQLALESCISENEKVEVRLDLGCCSLSFESRDSTEPGSRLGHLILRFKNNKFMMYGDTELLLSSLQRVLNSNTEFAVTYDFRRGHPSPKLASSIGRFINENRECWSRSAMTMALLIRGNIFVACAGGIIGSFLQMWLPGYPAIVCHCQHIAHEFFMANTSVSTIGSEFVSVVNIKEDTPGARVDGISYCLAFLAPLLPCPWDASNIESTLHVLPNGDVRVIQSPADDVMMCSATDTVSNERDEMPLSALKFEGSSQDLEQLIGAHFHIGELIADADIESRNRRRASVHLDSKVSMKGCWDVAFKVIALICDPGQNATTSGAQASQQRRAKPDGP